MNLFKRSAETLADQVDQRPRLVDKPSFLKGEWNLCAHRTGFWSGSRTELSDETGNYLRLEGECKTCKKQVFVIREFANEPA